MKPQWTLVWKFFDGKKVFACVNKECKKTCLAISREDESTLGECPTAQLPVGKLVTKTVLTN